MDNIKKQLRFFKVLVVVLLMIVLTQFTFWITSASGSSSSRFDIFPRVKPLQHSKVVAPAVSAAIDFFVGAVSK
jgi:hypothetical protein